MCHGLAQHAAAAVDILRPQAVARLLRGRVSSEGLAEAIADVTDALPGAQNEELLRNACVGGGSPSFGPAAHHGLAFVSPCKVST